MGMNEGNPAAPDDVDPESPAPVEEPAPAAPEAPPQAPAQPETVPDNTVNIIGSRKPIDPGYLKAQDAAVDQDVAAGHIHPQTFHELFAKKDTLGKIGTLFGLIVGGAGAGLTHSENPVMAMMKKEIDNDFEAQKQNVGNAQNFIKLNQAQHLNEATIDQMHKAGKLTDEQAKLAKVEGNTKAYALARMQMNRAALHSLVLKTQKLPPGSPARTAAEQQLAILYQGINNENSDIADRAAAASALNNAIFDKSQGSANPESDFQSKSNVLRMSGNAPMAENIESKHMPGVEGSASVPLNGGDRENITAGVQFQNELQRFMDWTKKHSGDLSPADKKYGEALAAQVQGAYRMATKGGVYKEGEQGFISSIIDSEPTKFFNKIRVLPQLKAVQSESASQLDDMLKAKGFKGYTRPEQYKMVGKVKYKRGPHGEAVKVE